MNKKSKAPLKIGSLALESNVIYSPLAGVSDYPFRQMSARYKPGLMFCEMVKTEPVVRRIKETYRMLEYNESMRPIGAQICGSDPKMARESAIIMEELGFDVIDFNCGCPVDKVTKKGCGSGLLKTPERIGEILHEMSSAVNVPVTVKVRAGWDSDCINAPLVTQIAEEAGAAAIFVHGRTRQQAYRGPAVWDHITACKAASKNMPVIGNGDVFSGQAALDMLAQTGCDGVLVSRGTMGQPWIIEEILAAMQNRSYTHKSVDEKKQALIDHFEYSTQFKDERGALIDLRRIVGWYIKNVFEAKQFRKRVCAMDSIDDVRALVSSFEWRENLE